MNQDILIVFGVFAGMAILFVTNRVRSDIVALMALLALMLFGVLTIEEALAGFAEPVIIIIASMFIVSEALVHTGIAQAVGRFVLETGGGSETRLVVLLMLAVGIVGAFMNSTAAIAIFIPIALSVADNAGFNRKRLLMPLSVGALISGMMTLIATAPNLVVNAALESRDLKPFQFFSFTPFGLLILVIGIIFMVVAGRRILAKEKRIERRFKGRSVTELLGTYQLREQGFGLRVLPNSLLIDHAVARLQIPKNFGIQLVAIERRKSGKGIFFQATPETVFQIGDMILVVGKSERVTQFAETFKLGRVHLDSEKRRKAFFQVMGLAEIMLAPDSRLIGKTLAESELRERYRVNVLGIRRRSEAISEKLAELPLDFGDAMLVMAAWPDIIRLQEASEKIVVLTLPREFEEIVPARKRAPLTLAMIVAMVVAMATGFLPTVTAAMLAAIGLIMTRCVKLESTYRIINWQALVLIAAILPVATALNKTGAAHAASLVLVDTLGRLGPFAMLAVIFGITAATGLFISNTATAVLIAPIAIDTAVTIGVSPQAFAMTVAIACSAAYVTPISSPVNMLVMEPGGYGFIDFVNVGLPLLLLTLIATVVLVGIIYI